MTVKSSAVVVGNSLLCTVENATDWHFFIRGLEGENQVNFAPFHRKEIRAIDVAKFIPHWKTLRWIKIKNSQLGHSESYMKDEEFEVNVYANPHSVKKHPDVIEAFLKFMNGNN